MPRHSAVPEKEPATFLEVLILSSKEADTCFKLRNVRKEPATLLTGRRAKWAMADPGNALR